MYKHTTCNKEYIEKFWLNPTLEYHCERLNMGLESMHDVKSYWDEQWTSHSYLKQRIRSELILDSVNNWTYE